MRHLKKPIDITVYGRNAIHSIYSSLKVVHLHSDSVTAALQAFRASLAIFERLAADDPTHAGWQRDLSVSHNKIGDVLRDQGDLAGALQAYRARHAIAERLAADDPSHAGWQRDVAVSYVKLALMEGSGVTWTQVAAKWQAIADRGILRPVDRKYLEAVKAKAAAER